MTDNEIKAQKIIISEVQNAIKLLENHLQKFCDDNETSTIPMNYVRTSVKLLLEGYLKGAEEATKQPD